MPVVPDPEVVLGCTPAELASAISCLQCVDGNKLMAFDVVSLAQLNGHAVNASTLRANAACFTCYGDEDLRRMETAVFCAMAQANDSRSDCSTQSLMDDAKCLNCLSLHDLRAIRLQMLCELAGEFLNQ